MERFERLQMTRPHLHLYALVDGWGYERLMEEPMEAMRAASPFSKGRPMRPSVPQALGSSTPASSLRCATV